MSRFRRTAALAGRQYRVITHEQLLEIGLTRDQIYTLVRNGHLRRLHRGVYALSGPLAPIGYAMAAVLRCQPRAAACRLTAMAGLNLRDTWPGQPQVVTARASNGKPPKNIDLHHTKTLRKRDMARVGPLPVTGVVQTIRDSAPLLTDDELKYAVRQGERLHDLDIADLMAPGVPANLRRVLKPYVATSGMTANEMEAKFFEICAHAGLPLPATQRRVGRYRVDFIWPELGLVVETDGRGSHAMKTAFVDDRVRGRRLIIDGYAVLHFSWAEIEFDPGTVARDLAAAITARTSAR